MNQNFMKEKPVLPLVISMALPMVISMAINSLYNIVDSYFVAKISEDAMTALSLVYPLQNLMTAVAVGFGIGMNARIAFCLGAGDQAQADRAATTGMLLSFIHGLRSESYQTSYEQGNKITHRSRSGKLMRHKTK